jgi:pyrophosphatase PpaX
VIEASAILFDLDGTLIDSIELICRSYEHAFAVHRKPAMARDRILAMIGIPLRTGLRVHARDEREAEAMVQTYREWNMAHHDELVRPFDGIHAALDRLAARKHRMAVVTSKLVPAAQHGLAHCGLADYFALLVGPEQTERHKPDPDPLLHACDRLGVVPGTAVYVGDSVHDMAAARAGGLRAVAAGWGPFAPADLLAAGAQWLLATPVELDLIT